MCRVSITETLTSKPHRCSAESQRQRLCAIGYFHGSSSCPSADRRPQTVKMREAPWSAAARRRLCIARTEFLVRRALKGASGASCNSAPRENSEAASSRRTPRCLRHTDFRSREESRSGLFSRHCEIPRRLRLLGMTSQEGFSAACWFMRRCIFRRFLLESGILNSAPRLRRALFNLARRREHREEEFP